MLVAKVLDVRDYVLRLEVVVSGVIHQLGDLATTSPIRFKRGHDDSVAESGNRAQLRRPEKRSQAQLTVAARGYELASSFDIASTE